MQKARSIYFASGARSHVDTDIYRIGLDGEGLDAAFADRGHARATFNPTFTHYVDTWSDVTTPPQVRLHRADGSEVRVIERNEVQALRGLPPVARRSSCRSRRATASSWTRC